jgi:hypothetical protein
MLRCDPNALRYASVALGFLIACSLTAGRLHAKEPALAFSLEGEFEETLNNKHYCSGSFRIKASGSNALVETALENGYREFAGTDGRDTFTYVPYSGDKSAKEPFSLAFISSGRFPVDTHFYDQLLWLATTRDPDTVAQMQNRRMEFYGDYNCDEITARVLTNGDRLVSIEWYAPPRLANGKLRYELPMYPAGWLIAKLSVSYTNLAGSDGIPAGVVFERYRMHAVTNVAQMAQFNARTADDVEVAGSTVFSIANIQIEKPLLTYIPQIIDKTAHVRDYQSKRTVQIASGRWWAVREALASENIGARRHRWPVIACLVLLGLFAVFIFLTTRLRRKATT